MRKFIVLIVFLLIASLGYLGYAHFSGGAVPTFGLPIGGEKAKIRARTLAFFEHVKFKNASAFKDFVAKDTSLEEVGHFMAKTIGIDADKADLVTVLVENIELDSSKQRARARVRLSGQDLSAQKPIDISKVVFLYRSHDDKWLIDIKNLSP